jgi:hypothetical protein
MKFELFHHALWITGNGRQMVLRPGPGPYDLDVLWKPGCGRAISFLCANTGNQRKNKKYCKYPHFHKISFPAVFVNEGIIMV